MKICESCGKEITSQDKHRVNSDGAYFHFICYWNMLERILSMKKVLQRRSV